MNITKLYYQSKKLKDLIWETHALANILSSIFINDFINLEKYDPTTLILMLKKRIDVIEKIFENIYFEIDSAEIAKKNEIKGSHDLRASE